MVTSFVRPKLSIPPGWIEEKTHQNDICTIYDLLEQSARLNANHVFAYQLASSFNPVDTLEITHSDLLRAVDLCSAILISRKIAKQSQILASDGSTVVRGDPVAIFVGSDIGIYIHLLALTKLGNPFALFSSRLSGEAVATLCEKANISHILVDQRTRVVLNDISSCKSRRVQGSLVEELYHIKGRQIKASFMEPLPFWLDSHAEDLIIPEKCIEVDPNDCSVAIFHSSGSTGLPKPIFHCHRYLLGYAAAHELPVELNVEHDVMLSTLPLYHGFGLLAPSLSLSVGMPVALPAATTIPTGSSTSLMIEVTGASRLCAVPSILGEILNENEESSGLSLLRHLKLVVVGGAPMKLSIGERLHASGVNLLNHFGVTEIGALAPICHPCDSCRYNWRYLLVRQDLNIEFRPLMAETEAKSNQMLHLGTRPFGWSQDFWVQDALETNLDGGDNRMQVRIKGRVDELLVLATGEKVSPIVAEAALRDHYLIDEAVMFGTGRFQVGLLVETETKVSLDHILPAVEELNKKADAHAQVDPHLIILTTKSQKPLIRTLKGNPERQKNLLVFEKEIEDAYKAVEKVNATRLELDNDEVLSTTIKDIVAKVLNTREIFSLEDDFFELGMDSFKALKLLRILQASVDGQRLAPSFIYKNASVNRLVKALRKSHQYPLASSKSSPEDPVVAVETCVEATLQRLDHWCQESESLKRSPLKPTTKQYEGNCIIITGSTGNLGTQLLRAALQEPLSEISHIYCLIRGLDPDLRQKEAMENAGHLLTQADRDRITVWSTPSLSREFLGLKQEQYDELIVNTSHILHNAWPVDFLRPLESFEPHISATARLIELGTRSTIHRQKFVTRLIFASSIATVAAYPRLHPASSKMVPEVELLDARYCTHLGYAQAKLACEQILNRGANPNRCLATSVRIGQLTGAEKNGRWSHHEHIPSIIKSSLAVGALPALCGTHSWLPADWAGKALMEILFSKEKQTGILHLENPCRQQWSNSIDCLKEGLGVEKVLPIKEWLQKVEEVGSDFNNPAHKILHFLQNEFIDLATGAVVLSTKESQARSTTLRNSKPVSEELILEYLKYWRSINFLPL